MTAITPGRSADPVLERARARLAAGDIAGARREALDVAQRGDGKQAAAAHLLLSACATRSGDAVEARAQVMAALQRDSHDALALYALAELDEHAGRRADAISALERAIASRPAFLAAQQRLGILYGEAGDAQHAADAFARVVAIDPKHARGYNNLGNALRTLGRTREALAAFQRAVELQPDYELAIANVAVMLRDAGEIERAEALLQSVYRRRSNKPPLRAIIVMLAGLLRERGALDEALPLYQQAIAMSPAMSAGEWFNLGRLFAERDEPAPARDAYRKSFDLDRRDLRGALASRLSLPMIYASASQLSGIRTDFSAALDALHAIADNLVDRLTPDEVLDGLRWTNFFLAYQGGDDRPLQAAYGALASRMIEHGAPGWRAPLADRGRNGRRLRVGFASAFFHVGTAGRYFRSWLTDLDRDRFDVCVYHLYPGLDDIASEIKARADRFVEFGGSRARPSVVAPVIRDDALDVLVYPELGMDHTSFALAALRLAPRQIAGWGHPVTSGHPTIDAFVTCGDMEPSEADAHYTERLLRLPGIGTNYRRPALPVPVAREHFGLPTDRTLLLCPQSLFKVHPDNDDLFARVLAANRDAVLVMFDGRHPNVTQRFIRRLTTAFERHDVSVQDRMIVLPALPHDDYLRVNLACDAMLDTLHWSGGNTTLDALACGLPVVTLPGAFMRGRQSAAMLRQVGAEGLIAADADDYIAIASRLANDSAWRERVARTIGDGLGALFDREEPVRAFGELLLQRA
ncbi:MAG TPA: tetratricopeptide repeat protein [Casimicrobiaceae bacterium]|nr:tetratricopeptide repeat protein [Casimicrobiaceae bacterium]